MASEDGEWRRRRELNSLLRTCRAQMAPPLQVPDGRGPRMLPQVAGGRRHGMRQQDVAALAGVSADYYSRIERGRVTISAALAGKIASALRMTEAQRSAVHVLAAGHDPPRPVSRAPHVPATEPGQALRDIVHQQGPYPAAVSDEMWTVRVHNAALSAWSAGWFDRADPPARNMVLYLFSGEAEAFLPDLQGLRRFSIAALRYQYVRNLASPRAQELVDRLLAHPEASKLWGQHELEIPPHEYPVRMRNPGSGAIAEALVVLTPIHPDLWLYIMHLPPVEPPAA